LADKEKTYVPLIPVVMADRKSRADMAQASAEIATAVLCVIDVVEAHSLTS
jgi:hypothetical protein